MRSEEVISLKREMYSNTQTDEYGQYSSLNGLSGVHLGLSGQQFQSITKIRVLRFDIYNVYYTVYFILHHDIDKYVKSQTLDRLQRL